MALTSDSGQCPGEEEDEAVFESDKSPDGHLFGPPDEPAYPVDGLTQLVGVVVGAGGGAQVRGAEAAQQQGQEEVQHLWIIGKLGMLNLLEKRHLEIVRNWL